MLILLHPRNGGSDWQGGFPEDHPDLDLMTGSWAGCQGALPSLQVCTRRTCGGIAATSELASVLVSHTSGGARWAGRRISWGCVATFLKPECACHRNRGFKNS